uniref:Ankyrin repeat and LEM domain containing 1 n=1 Tax=Pelodiscus sinensis TaxID=13735 RepID=K7G7Y2_PELSI
SLDVLLYTSRLVETLLKQGADPNLVLPEGIAAIHLAAGKERESGVRCLKLILQYGGNPNARSVEGLTPLHVAASWGCYKCLKLLLRNGGDPHLEDQDGNRAIDLALEQGNKMCVQTLQGFRHVCVPEEADGASEQASRHEPQELASGLSPTQGLLEDEVSACLSSETDDGLTPPGSEDPTESSHGLSSQPAPCQDESVSTAEGPGEDAASPSSETQETFPTTPSLPPMRPRPCHVTPRTKSRLTSAARDGSSSSSLFDETLEMPRRPRRVRSPPGTPRTPVGPGGALMGNWVAPGGENASWGAEDTKDLDATEVLTKATGRLGSSPAPSGSPEASPTVLLDAEGGTDDQSLPCHNGEAGPGAALRKLGAVPGPVNSLTRQLYVQLLDRLMKDPTAQARKRAAETLDLGPFDMGKPPLCKRISINPAESFSHPFVQAIFYVGRGKPPPPHSHLYQALTHHRGGKKQPLQAGPKVQHILAIWVHCFQNVIPVEAYTREACLVDAIGLQMLTNQKKGDYYGVAASWPMRRRRRLGIHMLHRAMQRAFLSAGRTARG